MAASAVPRSISNCEKEIQFGNISVLFENDENANKETPESEGMEARITWLSLSPTVVRSVASVIFFVPAVITCLSGGTPVRAKSCKTNPSQVSTHAHKAAQPTKVSTHAVLCMHNVHAQDTIMHTAPFVSQSRTLDISHEVDTKGKDLSLKELDRLICLHVHVIFAFSPLNF
jgi:hypothetical protein